MTVNNRTQLHRLIDMLPDSLLSEVIRFVELLLFKLQRPEPLLEEKNESEELDTPFIGDLTFSQFQTLPEAEKNQVWHEAIENNKTKPQDSTQYQAMLTQLCNTVQARDPYTAMSNETIHKRLRETREEVWLEQHTD